MFKVAQCSKYYNSFFTTFHTYTPTTIESYKFRKSQLTLESTLFLMKGIYVCVCVLEWAPTMDFRSEAWLDVCFVSANLPEHILYQTKRHRKIEAIWMDCDMLQCVWKVCVYSCHSKEIRRSMHTHTHILSIQLLLHCYTTQKNPPNPSKQ